MSRPRSAIQTTVRLVLLAAVVAGATGLECKKLPEDFLVDPGLRITDSHAPTIFDLFPGPSIDVLNDDVVTFRAEDRVNAADPAGLDLDSVFARTNGTTFPVTHDAGTFTVDIGILSQGPTLIDVGIDDLAGNSATARFGFFYDPIPPVFDFTQTPTGSLESNARFETFGLIGSIQDPNLLSAEYRITQPGDNGICGDADDVAFPTGTTGGTVSENSFNLTGVAGDFAIQVDAFNGRQSGDPPATAVYCGVAFAEDSALDRFGDPNPNTITEIFRLEITWSPPTATGRIAGTVRDDQGQTLPGATVTLDGGMIAVTDANGQYAFENVAVGNHALTYALEGFECEDRNATVAAGQTATVDSVCSVVVEGFDIGIDGAWHHNAPMSDPPSVVCGKISTDPAQDGVGVTVRITGPGGFDVTANGVLNAMGMITFEAGIGQFGTYTVMVTIAGETETSTIEVGAAQNTCPS